jgi:hypothetical protein
MAAPEKCIQTTYITDVLQQEANTDMNDLTHVPVGTTKKHNWYTGNTNAC